MLVLTGARLVSVDAGRVELALDSGYRAIIDLLDTHLARFLVLRPNGLRIDRTWSLSPELAGEAEEADALTGRNRLSRSGFPGIAATIAEDEAAITVETAFYRILVQRAPLRLDWFFRQETDGAWRQVLADRPTSAYVFDRHGPRLAHYLVRRREERYYGFGEKSGDADKHGRRLRMGTIDAMGYDAERSDPLYKHIPFYATVRPDRGGDSVGLFYDNLARGAFDLGQEIDAYHGDYRSFEAEDGDLDLYVVFGPSLAEVTARFTALTGRTALPPRWSLAYSGSTMQYTDDADPPARFEEFLALIAEHGIPCRSFQLSSGYTMIGDKRYVFHWNRDKFPDPAGFARRLRTAGLEIAANIKPALLTDHPLFAEVEAFRGFVRDSEDAAKPHLTQFWGGTGAYLDFTNPRTSAWWSAKVKTSLLDNGIGSTWNDNNEFEIWDDKAGCDLAGAGTTIATLRPVQTNLMMRASHMAQTAHAPGKRPYLISRSGGPGMQRYVQTWTGDNRTAWKTLRYNLRMGHGLSISGLFNFGHDIGGFAGPKPEPELFVRWIEHGIFWPRFTIHSWNDDGSANEPWMYPQVLPLVRAALAFRERLTPLLYTLLWRAHREHVPLLQPTFFSFPHDPLTYEEDDSFLLGDDLLVAPVVDPGLTARTVYLPAVPEGWFDFHTGAWHPGGRRIEMAAPLGRCPLLVRGATILPLGPAPGEPATLALRLFSHHGGLRPRVVFDDDGESILDTANHVLLNCAMLPDGQVEVLRRGRHAPRWTHLRLEDHAGATLSERSMTDVQIVSETP